MVHPAGLEPATFWSVRLRALHYITAITIY